MCKCYDWGLSCVSVMTGCLLCVSAMKGLLCVSVGGLIVYECYDWGGGGGSHHVPNVMTAYRVRVSGILSCGWRSRGCLVSCHVNSNGDGIVTLSGKLWRERIMRWVVCMVVVVAAPTPTG